MFKLNVFVSSSLSDRYKRTRKEIKNNLESTGMFNVYLFEDSGSSSQSLTDSYLIYLERSSICIFLIDNEIEVPEGVLKEYKFVKIHQNIKPFYIFYNNPSFEVTFIQHELVYSQSNRFKEINIFKDIETSVLDDILSEIANIYWMYCSSDKINFSESIISKEISKIETSPQLSFSSETFTNIDKTQRKIQEKIFSNFLMEISSTSDFDESCSKIVDLIFGDKNIKDINISILLKELKNMQTADLHEIVILRWEAIQEYYLNDYKKAIDKLILAYNKSLELKSSNWLFKDILIDIRNIVFESQKMKIPIKIDLDPQNLLDGDKEIFYYPIIDNNERRLYEILSDESFKSILKSPYSKQFGSRISSYGEILTKIFITSIFYGSYTHLTLLIKKLIKIELNLSKQFSDWEFKVNFLKYSIFQTDEKNIKDYLRFFNESYAKLDQHSAMEIYNFSKKNPNFSYREQSQLIAFEHLGYYFNDSDFDKILEDIYIIAENWIKSLNLTFFNFNLILKSLGRNLNRIDLNYMFERVILKITKLNIQNNIELYNLLKLLDISKLNEVNKLFLKEFILSKIELSNKSNNEFGLSDLIISFLKQQPQYIEIYNKKISKCMPEYFAFTYNIEILSMNNPSYDATIDLLLERIKKRNIEQGQNGLFFGYGYNSYTTLSNFIQYNDIILPEEKLVTLLRLISETIRLNSQSIDEKISAIRLLILLNTFYKDVNELILSETKNILENIDISLENTKIQMFFNSSTITLNNTIFLLRLITGDISKSEFIDFIADFNVFEEYEKISFLELLSYTVDTSINSNVKEVFGEEIKQIALMYFKDNSPDIRYYSLRILLNYLETYDENIMKRISESFDYEAYYIKLQILKSIEKIKIISDRDFQIIKSKALLDSHYLVRKEIEKNIS